MTIVKVATSPALIGPLPLLTTEMFGHSTTMLALDVLLPVCAAASFVAATVAVFGRVGSPPLVGPLTWTTTLWPTARSPNEQVRVLAAIEQAPRSSVQAMPAGGGSSRVTPLATPGVRCSR